MATADSIPSRLTVEEFHEQRQNLRCVQCRTLGSVFAAPPMDNGGIRIDCPCGKRHALGRVLFLKQNNKSRRKDYPEGESLNEVWERFENVCFCCGRSAKECAEQHVGRHRHHVCEYAKVGHQGPIVPICGLCHPVVTALQKTRALVQWSRTHVESVSDRRPGVSATRLSPDPLRAERQAPPRAVEGLPDDYADF